VKNDTVIIIHHSPYDAQAAWRTVTKLPWKLDGMELIASYVNCLFYIPLLFIVCLILAVSKQCKQLISPQVWDKDGIQILYGTNI